MIRKMLNSDSDKVLEIYKMGLDTRNATFETSVPSWTIWNSKHHEHSRFVYVENKKVLGWIALSPVSPRKVYQGVAEVSIYVDLNSVGRGIGSKLMSKAIESSEQQGIYTLFSSIFPENTSTIKLHLKYDFRLIGTREKIAQLDNQWRDTLILERRSKTIGT